MKNRLIVIRGNSGSGKSTLAKELRLRMVELGVNTALIGQDYIRRVVLMESDVEGGNNIDLIEKIVNFSFDRGYSVILEGILASKRYGVMLTGLITRFDSHVYYMDISFEETLRRHETKDNAHEFGEKEMCQWWIEKDMVRCEGEKVITEEMSLDESIKLILNDLNAGLRD
jgi:adenylylsulfate kinase-like enzyme